jgi:hypothetical protein
MWEPVWLDIRYIRQSGTTIGLRASMTGAIGEGGTMRRFYVLACVALLALWVGGCAGQAMADRPATQPSSSTSVPVRVVIAAEGVESNAMSDDNPITGLQFSLSQGEEQPQAATPLDQPPVTPLAPDEVGALFDRLPPLTAEEEDVQALALPPTSIPPPRTGATVQEPFPPPATPPPR